MPVSGAAPGFRPSDPPAAPPAPRLAAFARQGDAPVTGSPPAAAVAPVLAANSVMKHGSQAPLSVAEAAPVHTLTAGPGTSNNNGYFTDISQRRCSAYTDH
ncbi:hypothetical protein L798_00577 [Zootermopsis nevadensis]|uniref:Uncharacterized protein n=1 Tax=Zootermopsis nevadensis TaxID=136037 RepID=A0A067QJG8_ZOONE|nr:hypothetical protein L798_00577 [Zootermopsis nevadensis]